MPTVVGTKVLMGGGTALYGEYYLDGGGSPMEVQVFCLPPLTPAMNCHIRGSPEIGLKTDKQADRQSKRQK